MNADQKRILERLGQGPATSNELLKMFDGMTAKTLSNRMYGLTSTHKVERTAGGRYTLTKFVRAAAAEPWSVTISHTHRVGGGGGGGGETIVDAPDPEPELNEAADAPTFVRPELAIRAVRPDITPIERDALEATARRLREKAQRITEAADKLDQVLAFINGGTE